MNKNKINTYFDNETIFSNSQEAFTLYEKSHFGEKRENLIIYSLPETLYLLEKEKIQIFSKNKPLTFEELLNKLKKIDKRIQIKYIVFKDLREKGYIVKTALKFGADFRVYEKNKKPMQEHSKWIVFISYEYQTHTWQDFSSKNRVAHSTKKNLLLAIIDEEKDITYYEVKWIKI